MIQNAEQRSLDWYRARLGNFTGSQVGMLMKSGRGKDFSDTALSYIRKVAAERDMNQIVVEDDEMFGQYISQLNCTTKAMKWGIDQETNARSMYEAVTGREIVEVSSCRHKTIPFFASSPDGFYYDENKGEKWCIEIKCPNPDTYMLYLGIKTAEDLLDVNPIYYYQCHAHMMCTDSKHTDFVSYCPWQNTPLHIVTIDYNEEVSNQIKERIELANKFIKETWNL